MTAGHFNHLLRSFPSLWVPAFFSSVVFNASDACSSQTVDLAFQDISVSISSVGFVVLLSPFSCTTCFLGLAENNLNTYSALMSALLLDLLLPVFLVGFAIMCRSGVLLCLTSHYKSEGKDTLITH